MKNIIFTLLTFASACLTHVLMAEEVKGEIAARGLVLEAPGMDFQVADFKRNVMQDDEILIEILYSGICHSDIHAALAEHGSPKNFPIIPGHEIVGRVVQIGKNVSKFTVGDYAGVGCFVDSCGKCKTCERGHDELCLTRNPTPNLLKDGKNMRGGYSNLITIPARNAIKIPPNADLKSTPPLLCAGITVWTPIHLSSVKKGDIVGVAGFGGLGHMAVKYLVDLGAKVTVFEITDDKRADAFRMGAERYINMTQDDATAGLEDSFDFILSTIPYEYDVIGYMKLLKFGTGELAIVGLPHRLNVNVGAMFAAPGRKVYTSLVGNLKDHQCCMDYSVQKEIYPEVQVIPATPEALKKAYTDVIDGNVKFRYVIDMKTLPPTVGK